MTCKLQIMTNSWLILISSYTDSFGFSVYTQLFSLLIMSFISSFPVLKNVSFSCLIVPSVFQENVD